MILPANEEGDRLKLLNLSAYPGGRGTPGVGYQLIDLAAQLDSEPGSDTEGQLMHGDITDPEAGKMVCLDKKGEGEGTSYSMRVGKKVSPVDLSLLTDAELELIKPLEECVHVPTKEEQERWLSAYIGAERVGKINGGDQ